MLWVYIWFQSKIINDLLKKTEQNFDMKDELH
jgi:hypothetical protein